MMMMMSRLDAKGKEASVWFIGGVTWAYRVRVRWRLCKRCRQKRIGEAVRVSSS